MGPAPTTATSRPVGSSRWSRMRSTMASNLSESSTSSAISRCTSRMFTDSSMPARRQRLSQGCWQTRPVEAGSGLSRITERNASSTRPSLYSCRKRGMFMCSGQEFSQGESARSSHTPARQRLRDDVVLELVAEVAQAW